MFGRSPVLTCSQLYSTNVIDPQKIPTDEFVRKNLSLYNNAYSLARKNLRGSILTQRRLYNQKGHKYAVGDRCLLYHPKLPPGEKSKMHNFWSGPVTIKRVRCCKCRSHVILDNYTLLLLFFFHHR